MIGLLPNDHDTSTEVTDIEDLHIFVDLKKKLTI